MQLKRLISIAHRLLPLCPPKWRLPFLYKVYSFTGWDAEARWLKAIGPNRGLAIDVGANCGLYTWALSSIYARVVAFEPNKKAAATLMDAALTNVDIIYSGVSSKNTTSSFYVPRINGFSLAGWGSLDQNNCPNASDHDVSEIMLCTLDSFRFVDVGFVKIDVEGHEIEVLQGGMETIRRCMPHMLVEIKDHNLLDVRVLLQEWGYSEITLLDVGGPAGSNENYLFIPAKSRA